MATKKTRTKKTSPRKPAAKKKTSASPPTKPDPRMNGWITHTELASEEPDATKEWCAKVLGWTFRPSMPMPDGSEYHLYMFSDKGGGGIRFNNPPEVPGTIPYVQVASVKTAFQKALRAGAEEMMAPEPVMADLVIAIVRAPGGVPIGFAGPK